MLYPKTTYPANLRLRVQEMDEATWVEMLQTRHDMPPMPWPSVNSMSEQDTRALYQFIKSLGPKGEHVPAAVPPGKEPKTPFILFESQHMERLPPKSWQERESERGWHEPQATDEIKGAGLC